jgi:hypothetical protein
MPTVFGVSFERGRKLRQLAQVLHWEPVNKATHEIAMATIGLKQLRKQGRSSNQEVN